MSRPLTLLFCLSPLLLAQDLVIEPGVRVGPVTATSTEASLRQALGKDALKADITVVEGDSEPGLLIYPKDPTRRLAVLWNEQKPAHPAAVMVCHENVDQPCKWKTTSGIGIGTTLKELEQRNGKPFKLSGFGWDMGGNILSWEGGKLQQELSAKGLQLGLAPKGDYPNSLAGDRTLTSSNPALQKVNPTVISITQGFGHRK